MSGYVVPLDPNDMNRFVSYDPRNDDSFLEMDGEISPEELEELEQEMAQLMEKAGYRESVKPLLDKIPPREADIIELYYLQGKRQADIAIIFGVTQAAVSYRLGRGILRIKYLLDMPQVTREQMVSDLSRAFPANQNRTEPGAFTCEDGMHVDVKILVNMWETSCQSEIAKILGLTQGRVRHRFFKAVEKLQDLSLSDSSLEPYAEIFSKIIQEKKFNILREVKLPQWSNRGGNEII